jgi:hypothetical protein
VGGRKLLRRTQDRTVPERTGEEGFFPITHGRRFDPNHTVVNVDRISVLVPMVWGLINVLGQLVVWWGRLVGLVRRE